MLILFIFFFSLSSLFLSYIIINIFFIILILILLLLLFWEQYYLLPLFLICNIYSFWSKICYDLIRLLLIFSAVKHLNKVAIIILIIWRDIHSERQRLENFMQPCIIFWKLGSIILFFVLVKPLIYQNIMFFYFKLFSRKTIFLLNVWVFKEHNKKDKCLKLFIDPHNKTEFDYKVII